jgi:DNA-binding NarL/FixJ family response regulator
LMSSIRILVVDDYKEWRRRVFLFLQEHPEWQVICEVSDGLEAVQKAEELKPDLVLLDIGLPKLNGIEVARRVRQLSPNSKIVFLSMDNSPDIVEAALSTGAHGYVYKARAQSDLLPAIDAVLRGQQFVSTMLRGHRFTDISRPKAAHRHEVHFYSDDAIFLGRITDYVAAALKANDVAFVLATESHRSSLDQKLRAQGLDIDAAIRQGTYISLDAFKTLSTFMRNGMPDSTLLFELVGNLMKGVAKTGKKDRPRVMTCGECAPLLLQGGNADAAIQLEQLCNELATIYEVDTLCAYPLASFQGEKNQHVFQSICAEHSAVHSQEIM